MLDVILAEAGRHREALQWDQRLIAALERCGDTGSLQMNAALHNEAADLADCGDIRDALQTEHKLVDSVLAQQGQQSVPPAMMTRLGSYEVRVEETDAGLVWIDCAVTVAHAQGNPPAEISALLARAEAQAVLGHSERALPDLATAERLAGADPAGNRDALRGLRFERARAAAAFAT
jgi:hypothetical protein